MAKKRATLTYWKPPGGGIAKVYLSDGTPLPNAYSVSVRDAGEHELGTVTLELDADLVIATKRPKRPPLITRRLLDRIASIVADQCARICRDVAESAHEMVGNKDVPRADWPSWDARATSAARIARVIRKSFPAMRPRDAALMDELMEKAKDRGRD